MNKIKVGFTIGYINGIGMEIFLKVYKNKRLLEIFTPVLFGSINLCNYYKKKIEKNINN
ncbi:hypothetical protein [Blattabacterium cuenoti]|uniref:hypothetical protein n=1 Tax=Blattabacterium cuenoti TaxID=1653831 RepID=UPI00163BA865|nr:hypothetical protein [Blattabacterium cuenoti]